MRLRVDGASGAGLAEYGRIFMIAGVRPSHVNNVMLLPSGHVRMSGGPHRVQEREDRRWRKDGMEVGPDGASGC